MISKTQIKNRNKKNLNPKEKTKKLLSDIKINLLKKTMALEKDKTIKEKTKFQYLNEIFNLMQRITTRLPQRRN